MALFTTAAVFAGKFALNAAPSILNTFLGNDKANQQRKAARDLYSQQYQSNVAKLQKQYQDAYNATDAYNQALVAGHNNRVDTYDMNVALLQKEEAYAYEMAQLQAGSEVASFMEDNLDLLTTYVQNSGSLAASGMGTAASKLSELKNYVGGYLKSQRRRQGAAAGAIGGILRSMDKIEMQSNAQRDAMYQQVKTKPTLRPYPTMQAIPKYKVPDAYKDKGVSFGDLAPGLLKAGIAASGVSGMLKFPGGGNSGGGIDWDSGGIGDQIGPMSATNPATWAAPTAPPPIP